MVTYQWGMALGPLIKAVSRRARDWALQGLPAMAAFGRSTACLPSAQHVGQNRGCRDAAFHSSPACPETCLPVNFMEVLPSCHQAESGAQCFWPSYGHGSGLGL